MKDRQTDTRTQQGLFLKCAVSTSTAVIRQSLTSLFLSVLVFSVLLTHFHIHDEAQMSPKMDDVRSCGMATLHNDSFPSESTISQNELIH